MSAPPEVRQATADAACVMEMLSQSNIELECGWGGVGSDTGVGTMYTGIVSGSNCWVSSLLTAQNWGLGE